MLPLVEPGDLMVHEMETPRGVLGCRRIKILSFFPVRKNLDLKVPLSVSASASNVRVRVFLFGNRVPGNLVKKLAEDSPSVPVHVRECSLQIRVRFHEYSYLVRKKERIDAYFRIGAVKFHTGDAG